MTRASPTPGEPADWESLLAEARREHRAGRLAEAAAVYRQMLAMRGDIAETHNELGTILARLGKLGEAAGRFEQALALRPDFAPAHNNLGLVLKEQGQLDEAAARFEQALVLWPGYVEAHNNLGSILAQQGRLDQARARFEQALALRPDHADALNNLGHVLLEQGQLSEAAARFEQALALRPSRADAHYNLGNVLLEQGQLEAAAARFEQALALRPELAQAHHNLGNVLFAQGQLDQALAKYRQAIALTPGNAEAHRNLARALKQQGQLDEAAAHYRQAIALRPDFVESHCERADLKTFSADDPDLKALESLAADPGRLPPGKMRFIHFALAKALEDVGDFGRAFSHLLQGNALKRQEIGYDEAACRRNFQLIAEVFDSGLLDRYQNLGDPSPAPIFVLGMPRSGSTLVEQILASHPQVHAAGELDNLHRVMASLVGGDGRSDPFPQCISALGADGFRRLGRAYLASLPTLPDGKVRITDKMPGNFLYIGLIRLILPNARIVHTVRDPVDTCVSCFSNSFLNGMAFSYDLAELGRYYRWYHELMAHWRSVLPAGAMLDVSYEAVVDNLDEQARRLIDYCGLPWDDRCLSFHRTSRPIATASNAQVRRPLYRSSLGRWRRYEAYLDPLLAELGPIRRPD